MDLQDLRRRIYVKAKAETSWRFWGLYVHVCKLDTLREAYALAKKNDGAPGSDGMTFAAIEAQGVEVFLEQIADELVGRTYAPLPARKQEIPKDGGKVRVLSIPAIRDRVVQGALKLILEPIAHPRHDWLMAAVEKRLREELAELQVEINEEKSRIVDLCRGESFGFLGFDFRRVRSLRGRWRAHYTPKLKKRTALLAKLKDVFRRHQREETLGSANLSTKRSRGMLSPTLTGR